MFRGHLEPHALGASLVLLIKFNDSPAFTILLHILKCFSSEEKLKQDLYFGLILLCTHLLHDRHD